MQDSELARMQAALAPVQHAVAGAKQRAPLGALAKASALGEVSDEPMEVSADPFAANACACSCGDHLDLLGLGAKWRSLPADVPMPLPGEPPSVQDAGANLGVPPPMPSGFAFSAGFAF